jgi:serine/threonine protein kinase
VQVPRKLYGCLSDPKQLAPHSHVVRVFAIYVAKREVRLILQPFADGGDLENFLQDFRETNSHDARNRWILTSAFTCLASALSFMHRQKVLHKDIKPSNILIHQGLVVYTDFSYSLNHSDGIESTTTGRRKR